MKRLIIAALIISAFAVSCKKNQAGGKSTIKGKVAHHSKVIPFATVFIKFKAKDFPGSDTTVYDTKVHADANGEYSFSCYKGDYFLYGRGIDDAAVPPLVVGGAPVHIRNNETVQADIAVTED